MGTVISIIILLIIVIAIVLAIKKIYRNKKSDNPCGSCSYCSAKDKCKIKEFKEDS